MNRCSTATSLDHGLAWLVSRGQNRREDKEPTMTTATLRPSPAAERIAALLDLARERDDEPNQDYPELVALIEAAARRRTEPQLRRRPRR
jgi:hypothetical protein